MAELTRRLVGVNLNLRADRRGKVKPFIFDKAASIDSPTASHLPSKQLRDIGVRRRENDLIRQCHSLRKSHERKEVHIVHILNWLIKHEEIKARYALAQCRAEKY